MRFIFSILFLFSSIATFAQGAFDYVATAGGTDTYTATILVPTFPTSYTGVEMRITFTNANTGASTINITRSTGAIGAAAIRKWDGDSFEPLISGDIPAGGQITLRYTGSYFIMDSFGKGASGGSTPTLKEVIEAGNVIDEDESISMTGDAGLSIGGGSIPAALQITAAGTIALTMGSDASGDMWRRSSTGIMERRTPTQVRTDISAQPLSTALSQISGLSLTNDDFLQQKAGALTNRTIAQVKTDLGLTGTNTGDQTITLSGDATGSGTSAITVDLSDTGVGAGTYRTATVDVEGRVTAANNQEVQSFNTQTASYTLVLADADKKTVLMNVATANTLTVPTNGSVAFPIGTIINLMRLGAGATTVTPFDGTVTITSSSGSMVDPGANIECTLKKTGTNTWTLQNGLPSSTVISGTYTPTLTNVANLDASTAYTLSYYRVGNIVTVSGRVDLDPTTTATDTQLAFSPPISSNFTSANQAGGAAWSNSTAQGGAILSDATNDRLVLQILCNGTANVAFYFTCSYQVL